MPVVVGTVKSVVDIAQLASELVVEIVLPASVLVDDKLVVDKAFVAGKREVVDNWVGRKGNSVVEIVDQAASQFLATVAGNYFLVLVAVNSDRTVELGAATELKVVHRPVTVAFVVFVGAATAEAAFLEVAVVAALVAAASVEAYLVSNLAVAVVDAIDAAAEVAAFAALALVAAASVEVASTAAASAVAALPLQAFDTAVARVISATRLEFEVEP